MPLPRGVYILLAVLICGGFWGIYFEFLRTQAKHKRLKSSAPAKIEKIDVIRTVDPVFGNERTAYLEVNFTYTIDQAEFNRSTKMSGAAGEQFVPWTKAKVCYDAQDPKTIEEPELFPSQYTCGQ